MQIALAAFIFAAASVRGLEVPPPPTRWVTDRAGVLDPAELDRLDARLRGLEERTGAQVIVYILPSLEGDSLEDFSIRAAERWKVGQRKYDNGLILFVFPEDRLVRIEVGYGLEDTVTDAISSRIIRQELVPAFRRGEFGEGLDRATERLIALIERGEEPTPAATGPAGGIRVPFWVFLLIPLLFIFVLGPLSSRGALRGCLWPACWLPFLGGGATWGGRHGGGFGGGGFGGGGFGGFSGGGGGFGGGGASGSW
ncbi:MAG TPA: TPM domain-containing protein [Thermoanaerobaculia bacterium]|nr:TPM domain-containing protein [Thermoanaerobaculia bacterium]